LKVYTGTVFFIDLLGFGALTQGQVDIGKHDFSAHQFTSSDGVNEHIFSAKLLAKFRRKLSKIKCKNLKIAQLSDCAFIWSPDSNLVVEAARKIMWATVKSGILCRGGLSSGEIIEPDLADTKIGAFICGNAVTKAVKLESSGKGARVFLDPQIKKFNSLVPDHASLFEVNPDGRESGEFLWYKFPIPMISKELSDVYSTPKSDNDPTISKLIKVLQFSSRFRWNNDSPEGKIHMDKTVSAISDSL
jgi:hypothetical protein